MRTWIAASSGATLGALSVAAVHAILWSTWLAAPEGGSPRTAFDDRARQWRDEVQRRSEGTACDCEFARRSVRSMVRPESRECKFAIQDLSDSGLRAEFTVSGEARKVRAKVGSAVATIEVASPGTLHRFVIVATGLPPDSPQQLEVHYFNQRGKRESISSGQVYTRPRGSLVRNPSFERKGSSPHAGSRFSPDRGDAAQWTPYHLGGYRRLCRPVKFESGDVLSPRSGSCHLLLAAAPRAAWDKKPLPEVFGAHQMVEVPHALALAKFVLGVWFFPGSLRRSCGTDGVDTDLYVAVHLVTVDGNVVEVDEFSLLSLSASRAHDQAPAYQYGCFAFAHPAGIRAAHVFVNRRGGGASDVAFIDDVDLRVAGEGADLAACQRILDTLSEAPERGNPAAPSLLAERRPQRLELTIAVPLTADLMPRLATFSRHYGGPVVAAVLVRNREQAEYVVRTWSELPWLRERADVVLCWVPTGAIPINGLRNRAAAAVESAFIAVIDVDFVPSAAHFCCFFGRLSMLPKTFGSEPRVALVAPQMLIADGLDMPEHKDALRTMLQEKTAHPYCTIAQSGINLQRWPNDRDNRQYQPQAQSEPFVILRREEFVPFDERFIGYGFNKVAWANAMYSGYGFQFFTLSKAFLVHHNHPDQEWKRVGNETLHLQVWRRLLDYVAENDGTLHSEPPRPQAGVSMASAAG